MWKRRLIPILLLKEGRLIKTREFGNPRDVGSPTTQAKIYDAQFADELVFLDIAATNEGRKTFTDILRRVAEECFMPLAAGGGVRTIEDATDLLRHGADKVVVNSAAVERPALVTEIAERYGRSTITVSLDFKKEGDSWKVYTHGGTKATGRDLLDVAKEMEKAGAGELLITSIERDGMMTGYDLEAIKRVSEAVSIPVIASGGCSSVEDLALGIEAGASAVSAGSLFYFNDISVFKAHSHLKQRGIPVRHSSI